MSDVDILNRGSEANSSRTLHLGSPAPRTPITDDLTGFSRNFWLRAVRQRLNSLLQLRSGWDGYNAPRIAFDTALFASQVLQDLWRSTLAAPSISPLSSGGLMFEWCVENRELTLEIERPYVMSMAFETESGDLTVDPVGSNLQVVVRRIDDLLAKPTHTVASV